MNIEILGLIAGALTTTAFLPQVIKTYQTKSAKDLSLGMFLLFVVGLILWLIYGLVLNSLSIIVANALTLCLAIILLIMKLVFKD